MQSDPIKSTAPAIALGAADIARARFEYEITDTAECGIVLTGSEVKSLRNHKLSLDEAYARVRDGELWATDVQWTDAAKRGVEAKEWLYYSPAFAKTAKNVPTWLISVGLTNDPSLWNLDDMAVAASALYPEATKAVLAAEPAMLLPVPTVQQPISDATNAAAAEQTRREFAMRAAISWCVQNPATKRPNPEAPQHPAAIAPLTGVYADPEANGGFQIGRAHV